MTQTDPTLKLYERAVKAVHGQKWEQAEKLLRQLIDQADVPEIVLRAQQYLDVCERKGETPTVQTRDSYLRAVYDRNAGNLKEALAACNRDGRREKDDRFAYLAASVLVAQEEWEEAAKALQVAIELNPKNLVHARNDADFAELREHEEFGGLFDAI